MCFCAWFLCLCLAIIVIMPQSTMKTLQLRGAFMQRAGDCGVPKPSGHV